MSETLYFTGEINDSLSFTGDGTASQIISTGVVAPAGPKGDTGDKGDKGDTGTPGVVQSIVAGTNTTVNNTDPANPIISSSGDVQSVNAKTGVVVLTQDDVLDGTTNKQYSSTDKTRLATITDANYLNSNTTKAQVGLSNVPNTDFTSAVAANTAKVSFDSTSSTRLANTSGTNTGDQTTVTGNAGTATKLATARNINGVAFDGTANITVADSTKVPTSTTVNGHALSSNVTVSKSDVGLGNVTNDAQLKVADLDTDTSLAANSDTKIASQKATKTYVNTTAGAYVPLAGGTMTGRLTVSPTADGFPFQVMGDTSSTAFLVKNNATASTSNVVRYVSQAQTAVGNETLFSFQANFDNIGSGTQNTTVNFTGYKAGTAGNLFRLQGGLATFYGNALPTTDSTYTLGTSSAYWLNTYTDRLFLNSTAYIDGSTAGRIAVLGVLYSNTDVEITDSTKGIILKDSSGGRWRVTVATDGSLTTAAA